MKTLVIVDSSESLKLICKDDLVLCLNPKFESYLESKEITYSTPYSYNINVSNVRKDSWRLLNDMEVIRLKDHKTIGETLTYNGFPLFTESKLPFYLVLFRMLEQLETINYIIEEENVHTIKYYYKYKTYLMERDFDFLYNILKELKNQKKIVLKVTHSKKNLMNLLKQKSINSLKNSVSKYRSNQRNKFDNYKQNKNKQKILFFHHGKANTVVTDSLYKEIDHDKFDCIYICSDGFLSNSLKEHLDKENFNYIFSESYIDNNVKKKINNYSTIHKKAMNNIHDVLKENMIYKNYNIYNIIDFVIKKELDYSFKQKLTTSLSIENIIKSIKPSSGVVVNEYCLFCAIGAYMLNHNNIKSYCVAQGPLADIYIGSVLISDKMLVWSKLEKEHKITTGINKNKLVAIGTDSYKNIKKRIDKIKEEDIIKKLNLSKNKKIITFACKDPVKKDYFRIKALNNLINNDKNISTIIKLHPSDKSISISKLEKIFPNFTFVQDITFYELAKISDLVISNSSCRTSIDTIMFNIPLILWDPQVEFDPALPGKINYDIKIKPFKRFTGFDKISKEEIDDMLFNKKTKEKYINLSKQYSKYYSGLDTKKAIEIITN